MFKINDDLSIHVTRGDIMFFTVSAVEDENGAPYKFAQGDVLRFKVTEAKNCGSVVLQKDFPVTDEAGADEVECYFYGKDTKLGDVISKPKEFWYEIELNPDTNPQTIIGYTEEAGPAILRLFPEGADID